MGYQVAGAALPRRLGASLADSGPGRTNAASRPRAGAPSGSAQGGGNGGRRAQGDGAGEGAFLGTEYFGFPYGTLAGAVTLGAASSIATALG